MLNIRLTVLGTAPKDLSIEKGTTIEELLDGYEIDIDDDTTQVLLNGDSVNGYQELRNGDRVTVAKNVVGG